MSNLDKEQNENKDRLSKLADDILVSILSLVERKDATRTSILSRSWRYLATYFTSMDFDLSQTFLVENEKQRFLNWVNQVVTLHRAPFINDFRICFPLDSTHSHYINMWIKFAISKRVNKLELDFTNSRRGRGLGYSLSSNVFNGSPCKNGISYLTSICLKYVDIRGEVLELLLSRCHLLERLYIKGADNLSNVNIINLSEKLKYLAIHNCFLLTEVEIHAVSLQSFEFTTDIKRVNVVYASVPSLVEACFRWRFVRDYLLPNFLQIKCFPSQLSNLSLDMCMIMDDDLIIPSFPNVKYLELRVVVDFHRNLLPLICFAEACPLLHQFKLEVKWWCDCGCIKVSDSESNSSSENELDSDSESENELDSNSESENELDSDSDSDAESEKYNLEDVKYWLEMEEEGTNATLPNLRKLEWIGAFSIHDKLEFQLALYCLKNAIILEKFICIPRDISSNFDDPADIVEINEAERRRARKLASVIPSHVDYVIL